jgi:hypothetical protein
MSVTVKLCSVCGAKNKIALIDFGGHVCQKCLDKPAFVSPAKYRPKYEQTQFILSESYSKKEV